MGIDPGSRVTGYGVIQANRRTLTSLAYGQIAPKRDAALSECLRTLYSGLAEIAERMRPDAIAIEDIFFGKNVRSLIKQGQVRGAAILAGSQKGIPIFEYSPLEIKKAVVGYGLAQKDQVQMMVKAILHLSDRPQADAADALAAAICHAHFRKVTPV
ncbi:MAG TPA: crossover junction endodeoxyribonuclease RuvC [Syntrophales bacterium]|nr:crossover junction endodeoxyribonuclease RuvC [Syntrophales bacterium]